MATTVAQHPVTAFTSPTNGTSPIDADEVVANDSAIRSAYNAHDADTGIHVQSSVFGSRPAAGTSGRKYITVDQLSAPTQIRSFYDDGTNWYEHNYFGAATTIAAALTVSSGGIAVTGNSSVTGTLTVSSTINSQTISSAASFTGTVATAGALTVSTGGITVTGNSTITGTLGGITTLTATTVAGTLSTAAQPNVTSVGTLTALTVSGDVTVDTDTLKVDSSNNRVGIGTASPAYLLDVQRASYGVSGYFATLDGTNNPRMVIYGSSSGTTLQHTFSTGSDSLIFAIGGAIGSGTEAMRITADLRLGIGTASPSTPLHVVGASTLAGAVTVSSGGIAVTGNSTITGTLGGLTGLTVASGGAAITGNSTITGTTAVAAGSTTNALTVTTTGAIQQSIRYDGSNRLDVSVGATGAVTFDAVGTDASVSFADEVAVGGATVSSTTALMTPAATTGVSSLRIPHGTSPATPVNGDVWTDTLGMYVRINGVTQTIAFV